MRLLWQKKIQFHGRCWLPNYFVIWTLCLYFELHKLPAKVNKVNGCTQETRSFPQYSMHLEFPELPEISSWKLFYSCCCLLWRSSFCWLPKRPRGDTQWESQWYECAKSVSLCLKARVKGGQIVKWNWGGSSGELQCKYPGDRSNRKTGLIRADCLSLPHRPIWKDILDNLFQRLCSLFSKEKVVTSVF